MSEKGPALIRYIWDAILNDKWMWIPVWGEQRTGKTTIQMQCSYAVYKDWDKVLASFVFNLSGLLYKIDSGQPERIWELKKLHYRVPIVLYDDLGGQSNKAETQYDRSWDVFKGGFDLLGTKVAVIMGSMVDPAEPTHQIHQKYTHEIFVPRRGVYKFDRVIWDQDYKGWKQRRRKEWIETNKFNEVPRDIYKTYDEMRMALVEEMEQRIRDAMVDSKLESVIKRLNQEDIKLMELLQTKGPTNSDKIAEELGLNGKDALIRGKARSLIIPISNEKGNYYRYDLTDLGYEVLQAVQKFNAGSPVPPVTQMKALNVKPMTQQVGSVLDSKKSIAESYRFQGLRVTESFDSTEPDLVVWKDALTPQEVVAVKNVQPPCKVNIPVDCAKEVEFAKKFQFSQIHLVCLNSLGAKIYDAPANLDAIVDIDIKPEEVEQVKPLKAIDPAQKKNKLLLNLKLRSSPVEMSDRVIAVSETFGVGADDQQEFTIFDNIELSYDDDDLIYCTGDSGSGKSTFLRLLNEHLTGKGVKCGNLADISPNNEESVINSVGKSQEEAMQILANVGLSEAFLMLRKYRELSEGQKYRYRLAKLFCQENEAVFIDEFGATLDREMARTLAYSIQKWARRNKKMVVIATTHKDLIEDFNPNVLLDKKFGQQTEIKYFTGEPRTFSLVQQMKIEPASHRDYESLKCFHYLHGNPAAKKSAWKITLREENIGVIVYTLSFQQLKYRNQIFPEYKNNIQLVNKDIQRISRIIIHPKYRGVGLAHELIRRTMPLTKTRIIEAIAAMAKYNPFFEKAGLKYVGKQQLQPPQLKLKAFIERLGGNLGVLQNKAFAKAFLNKLSQNEMQELQKIIELNIHSLGATSKGREKGMRTDLNQGNFLDVLIKLLPIERVYLYWLNPQPPAPPT